MTDVHGKLLGLPSTHYLQDILVKDTMLDLYQWMKVIGIEYDKLYKHCSFWYNVDLSVFDKTHVFNK